MSDITDVTVCITTFRRADRLHRAILSAWNAGFRRLTVSAPAADAETIAVLETVRAKSWLSYDYRTTTHDIGCNNSWALAAYLSKTKRVILLHDDDLLHPALGKEYEEVIAPCMDRRDAGFASWEAYVIYDDGKIETCPYTSENLGDSPMVHTSDKLRGILDKCLTLSPVISVLNRSILIRACKEAAETLHSNDSIERPGMLLGTELLVYYRHCDAFKRWLHLPDLLSFYGSHVGSGTIKAQQDGEVPRLVKGYNLARRQAFAAAPMPVPKMFFVHSTYEAKTPEEADRNKTARKSWNFHFDNFDAIDLPYVSDGLPKIRDILDHACVTALPEDIIVYANADAGLSTHAFERIKEGIDRGRGVTCCPNHRIYDAQTFKNLTNCKAPGGVDVIAMTPAWWKLHREKMPDMYIGREAWDICFCALAEEWADGCVEMIIEHDKRLTSRAHTFNVCWHKDHESHWQTDRLGRVDAAQRHNRELARKFFTQRMDNRMLDMLK